MQQDHPGDPFLGQEKSEASAELSLVLERRAEFTYHASVSQWIAKADRMNKDFFSTFRERTTGSHLRAVRHSDGTIRSQPDEVLSLASNYFEALFVPEVLTPEIRDARADVWSHVPTDVTLDMQRSLLTPFSAQELRVAVSSLDASSCPGDNGLTRQFFLEFWDLLHRPLLQGFQHMFDTGTMPTLLTAGLIALIPKGGDPTSLRQWRPITLLSSSYKILALLISARLKPFMPRLIHGSQTAFIQDK